MTPNKKKTTLRRPLWRRILAWPFVGRGKYRPPTPRARFQERLVTYFSRLIITLIILTCLILAAGLAHSVHGFLYRSGYFDIREISIHSLPTLAEAPESDASREDFVKARRETLELLRQKGYDTGNLAALDIVQVREAIESLSKIREAHVRKHYPGVLEIDLLPREILALAPSHDTILAIDREGFIVETFATDDPRSALYPFLTGLDFRNSQIGDRLRSESLTKSLHLLSSLKVAGSDLAQMISDMHTDAAGNLTILIEGGAEIRFGDGDPVLRMPALETFIEKKGPLAQYQYIDLRFSGQVAHKPRLHAALDEPLTR